MNAIIQGTDPDQVQAIRHWQSREMFLKHYVHSNPALAMMDRILTGSDGTTRDKGNKVYKNKLCVSDGQKFGKIDSPGNM